MAYVQVIWSPEKSRIIDPSVPALDSPVRFPVIEMPQSTPGKRGNANQDLEVKAQAPLRHGSNRVEQETWTLMASNPLIQRFIDVGAIHVIIPRELDEGAELTGTTLDFELSEALKIVTDSLDVEWLENCDRAETSNPRKGHADHSERIKSLCRSRIKQIQQSAKKTSAAKLGKEDSE